MKRLLVLALLMSVGSPAFAQSFSCSFGKQGACLDYGDKVCSSSGKCVDSDAACFDTYQCNYEGFTCRSNVTKCIDRYDSLLTKHNNTINDYNDLLRENKELVTSYNELLDKAKVAVSASEDRERCVRWATTLAEAQDCF